MMNWKGYERGPPWLNFKVLSRHLLEGTEENHEEPEEF
jgi:hypothetical protein